MNIYHSSYTAQIFYGTAKRIFYGNTQFKDFSSHPNTQINKIWQWENYLIS